MLVDKAKAEKDKKKPDQKKADAGDSTHMTHELISGTTSARKECKREYKETELEVLVTFIESCVFRPVFFSPYFAVDFIVAF